MRVRGERVTSRELLPGDSFTLGDLRAWILHGEGADPDSAWDIFKHELAQHDGRPEDARLNAFTEALLVPHRRRLSRSERRLILADDMGRHQEMAIALGWPLDRVRHALNNLRDRDLLDFSETMTTTGETHLTNGFPLETLALLHDEA